MTHEEILKARNALAIVYDAVPVVHKNSQQNPIVAGYLELVQFIDTVAKTVSSEGG